MIDIYEVVKRLNGRIEPIGETTTDNARLKNLQELTQVMDKLFDDIANVYSDNKNCHEWSKKQASNEAKKYLISAYDALRDIMADMSKDKD